MIQRLAGGIAHDFNNLLTGIVGNASLILDASDSGRSVDEYASDILSGAGRAAELTRYLLAFSGQRMFVTDVRLPSVVRQVERKVRPVLPDAIALETRLDERAPPLKADESQITDLVEILLRNALDAIQPVASGRITISVSQCGGSVVLEVRDDGRGIDPRDLPRIFEPFFTTKFLGRGLGLAAAEGIAKACGGEIRVESKPGAGATFRVVFPE